MKNERAISPATKVVKFVKAPIKMVKNTPLSIFGDFWHFLVLKILNLLLLYTFAALIEE
jgi:hypothetical protein